MGVFQDGLYYKRLLDLLPVLVDERTGIIGRLEEQPRQVNMPSLFYYLAHGADTRLLTEAGYAATAAGVSVDRDKAISKAVGEAVERYCGGIPDPGRLVFSSFRSLAERAVDPGSFALFSNAQYEQPGFPFQPFTADTSVRWIRGLDLDDRMPVLVPAALVHVPYRFLPDEAVFCRPGSTGLAAHCSFEEAALNGLLEVIERDCLSITWQARMVRPLIDIRSLPGSLASLLERFTCLGYSVALVDIRNETGIPAVLGVLEGRAVEGLVPLALGASAHLDPVVAARKCLEELSLMERYTRRAMAGEWAGTGPDHAGIRSFQDHVLFHQQSEHATVSRFLTESRERVSLSGMENLESGTAAGDLEQVVRRLRANNCDALAVDVTTPDVRALGLHVVRALVPQYHPHAPGFATRHLGGTRLWTIPRQLGYPGVHPETGDYPFPHAFA